MFTRNDYVLYFNEVEDIVRQTLVLYTDLINELNDQAIKSKLSMIISEEMDTFKFLVEQKEKLK